MYARVCYSNRPKYIILQRRLTQTAVIGVLRHCCSAEDLVLTASKVYDAVM